MEKGLKFIQEEVNQLTKDVYRTWLDLHQPYWDLEDCRDYMFRDLVAAYQLGVSIELERLGY